MQDPLQAYSTAHRLVELFRQGLAGDWRVWVLIFVTVAVAWRVVFAWLAGSILASEAFVICLGIGLSEAAAVKWVGEFQGLRFLLLPGIPLAMWGGGELIARVACWEFRRTTRRTDLKRFRSAISRDPTNVAARVLLGDTYLKLGQFQRAQTE